MKQFALLRLVVKSQHKTLQTIWKAHSNRSQIAEMAKLDAKDAQASKRNIFVLMVVKLLCVVKTLYLTI